MVRRGYVGVGMYDMVVYVQSRCRILCEVCRTDSVEIPDFC